eukprot:TRINITY_DN15831_c0_g1_i1.p1 TRINITY_DN15831_c0_g1~~TRINITY_DN15831_c0_g1_i1.p1  ORF type:complete len:165 (-),score=42.69 TRINITY_DN15831_c0_g1_i1:74-568(-)
MIRRPPRSTQSRSSAASDVYKRQVSTQSTGNQNVAYSGPMIVMVNNFSASASEILAAALKDYNRAVIVGNHTFGKGTVQTMTDLNRYVGEDDDPSRELGSFKFTIQQFYRVNGASTQLKGVHPHIYLPNPYGYMDAGIESYDNCLLYTSPSPRDRTRSRMPSSA